MRGVVGLLGGVVVWKQHERRQTRPWPASTYANPGMSAAFRWDHSLRRSGISRSGPDAVVATSISSRFTQRSGTPGSVPGLTIPGSRRGAHSVLIADLARSELGE